MTALAGRGLEWVVEAVGCDAARLASVPAIRRLLDDVILAGALRAVGDPIVHQFPEPGGVTGMVLLAESHLAVHTFPEHGSLCLNLFCCVPRPSPDWERLLGVAVGAREVRVRRLDRDYARAAGVEAPPSPLAAPAAPVARIPAPAGA